MEYLKTKQRASPKLQKIKIESPDIVFESLLEFLAICWQKANLVHGDFSPYNILWHDGKPVVIDVGQAVVQSHPKAQEFLVRDVTRLVEWGIKNGIDITLAEAMFEVLNMNVEHAEQVQFEEE
jgi:serine/threonine-protein kinase RIO1